MSSVLKALPPDRLAHLKADYAEIRRAGRRQVWLAAAVILTLTLLSAWMAEVEPGKLLARGDQVFDYFGRLLHLETGPRAGDWVWTDPGEWFWGWKPWLRLLADTLLMAYVGTLLGAMGGFALGLLASTNIVANAPLRWTARRLLEFGRTVPDLVFALVFVIAFGLGPLPGVLALAIHSAGALGKQASEIIENIDRGPIEGCVAAGASWTAMVRFGVLPQILSGLLAYGLLRFEINVRSAAVLGFVGAGGIGQDLIEAVRKFYYNDVAALLALIIATVWVIDIVTGRLRARLLDAEERP